MIVHRGFPRSVRGSDEYRAARKVCLFYLCLRHYKASPIRNAYVKYDMGVAEVDL